MVYLLYIGKYQLSTDKGKPREILRRKAIGPLTKGKPSYQRDKINLEFAQGFFILGGGKENAGEKYSPTYY